jgi:D-glycero-alpha-D-manno-heptose-7-phosphate kinase
VQTLTARAPVRIDFGGGWTDVPPYSTDEGGRVCNLAIARHAVVRVEHAPGEAPAIVTTRGGDGALAEAAARRSGVHGVRIELKSDFPIGAGLGGSSAAGVAVAGALMAWQGAAIDRAALAERSRETEVSDLGVAGGRQDHYAAAFGGALDLGFGTSTTVRQIPLPTALASELEARCVVVYTGASRISGDTITAVLDAYRARTPRVIGALGRMKALAGEMADALDRASVDDLARLVGEHWVHQRALHPAIPTPLIDELLDRARLAGALGGKALGASGGGCVLAIAAADRADDVRAAVASLGEVLPVRVDQAGLVVNHD